MRVALFADIHGNSIALDAVLAELAHHLPDLCCFVGDLVDGHDPSGVLARIAHLPHARFLFGNTEQYILSGQGPSSLALDVIKANPERLPIFQQATASWAWTKGWLSATGWLDWLQALPLEVRIDLPNRDTLLCVHSTLGYADGPGIGPHIHDKELVAMYPNFRASGAATSPAQAAKASG
jgi:Icc-related predicted phosphoesterase